MSGDGKTSATAPNKPQRDEKGRLLPGNTANGGGWPKLPEWLKERGPEALKYIADVALGVEEAEPDLRLKAAAIIVDRYYGKAREQVVVSGDDSNPDDPLVLALVGLAKAATEK